MGVELDAVTKLQEHTAFAAQQIRAREAALQKDRQHLEASLTRAKRHARS